METSIPGLAGLVLAGGQSRRMSTDKAALQLDGVSFLDRARRLLAKAGAQWIRVAGRPGEPDGFPDTDDDAGPARALIGALAHLPDGADRLIVVPVDMPLLKAEDLSPLIAADAPAAWAGHPFPLFLRRLDLAGMGEPPASMRGLLDTLGAERPRPGAEREVRFLNVNTPLDFAELRTRMLHRS